MIDDDQLLAYALGESDAAEEHVLACSRCADRVATFLRLGPALGELVRTVQIATVITPALVAQLEAGGLVSRRYALAPGTSVPCTVGATDLYSLVRLAADFTGVARVDLVRFGQRTIDVPFDAATGTVYLVATGTYLRTLPTMKYPLQLIAVDDRGERVLGDYLLEHTAYVPG